MEKFESLEKALDALEQFDLQMQKKLEEGDYASLVKKITSRMSIISQINQLIKKGELSDKSKEKIKVIWEKSNQVQDLLSQKMGKISERLNKRKKNKQTLRKFAY